MSGAESIWLIVGSSVLLSGLCFAFYLWIIRNHRCWAPEVDEPDAITRLAAVVDPKSEAAEMVRAWKAWVEYRDTTMPGVEARADVLRKRSEVLRKRCSYLQDLAGRHQKRLTR